MLLLLECESHDVLDLPRGGGGEFGAFDEAGEELVDGIGLAVGLGLLESLDHLVEPGPDGGVADAIGGGEVLQRTGLKDELGDQGEVLAGQGRQRMVEQVGLV